MALVANNAIEMHIFEIREILLFTGSGFAGLGYKPVFLVCLAMRFGVNGYAPGSSGSERTS
jgi:hypothetical protein